MNRDGKQLEALVAFVEKTLVPEGFKVTTNDRVFNDDGIQIAEFDVHVQGKLGTSEFQWLIECRDRPSSGAAPTSWIEQLVGRRTRFNLSKVTAVSTTGFAAGAREFAQIQGIELREVLALTPEHFADWLEVRYIRNTVRHTTLTGVYFALEPETPQELHDALAAMLPSISGSAALLRAISTGELVTPAQAFSGIASVNQELFEGLEPNGEPKVVHLVNRYPENDYFIIQTPRGEVPIKTIEFTGELRIKEFELPIVYTGEYRDTKTGAPISQVVSYAPQSIMGNKFSVEFHKLADSGETHITMRRLPNDGWPFHREGRPRATALVRLLCQTVGRTKRMERVLASPNRLVWVYASAARTLAREAGEAGSPESCKEKAAAAVTMAVACVETYLNVLARLRLAQDSAFEHRGQVENDLNRKKSLGRKLEEWPQLFFGKKVDLGIGAGQQFKSLLDLRNRLMHFTSDAHDFEHENVLIRGLIDISAYDALNFEAAWCAVVSAESFIEYLLQLQGIAPDRIPHAMHHWLGRPPKAV